MNLRRVKKTRFSNEITRFTAWKHVFSPLASALPVKTVFSLTIKFKKGKLLEDKTTVVIESAAHCCVLKAWQQGIIPHEMVHFAVEFLFPLRGFIRLVAEGFSPEELTDMSLVGREAIYAEGLTNAYQYELWGLLPATNENFLNQIKIDCEKHQLPMMEVSVAEIERGRELLKEFTGKWRELEQGNELILELPILPVLA